MKSSERYKSPPEEYRLIQFTFPILEQLSTEIYYPDYLNTRRRLKTSRAIRLNKPILLVQKLKTVYTPAVSKPKTYYKTKETEEIISDEDFIERYRHYADSPQIKYDPVYLNNRMGVLDSISKMMEDIPRVKDTSSCDKNTEEFQRMTHQEIIRRYINSYTPYRGLLLFHGLGSGKTCSSISLIEGLISPKKVVIMTPASLQSNYRTQMKFCGEHLFRKNNHWVFERFRRDTDGMSKDYLSKKQSALEVLQMKESPLLEKFIDEIHGLWMVQKTGEPNFHQLSVRDKEEVDRQLTILIKEKYTYINYNGINQSIWKKKYKKNGNPFDNSTVIIDEAHNFVSRIVNKLNAKKSSISVDLYEEIMSAENCRVILLTGTPFINYPYELGTLFNLIHGYTYILNITIKPKKMVTQTFFESLLLKEGIIDLIEYDEPKHQLRLIKNPYGFLKQPDGKVVYSREKQIYYSDFVDYIVSILKKNGDLFDVGELSHSKVKHMPDTQKLFDQYFLSTQKGTQMDSKLKMFQLRIIGMVSYLGDKTNLMPKLIESNGKKIHIETTVMSPQQVSYYAEVRRSERKELKQTKKKDDEDEESSSYRIFSRAACNFVFPSDFPRPMPFGFGKDSTPTKDVMDHRIMYEALLDDVSEEDLTTDVDGKFDTSDLDFLRQHKLGMLQYKKAIDDTLAKIEKKPEDFFEAGLPKLVKMEPGKVIQLDKYSPKFKRMLENILSNPHCHLIYSNFRKLEGIGLFRLALLYHGFQELKIVGNRIVIHSMFEPQDYIENRYFSLFTGTETTEEKEIILNIYNNRFKNLPKATHDDLIRLFGQIDFDKVGNRFGDIIKILMITASGAEGIDLKNTRFVHIMEPYWHHVRVNQVIGRARRICSHMDLPKDLQDVTVFMYLSVFGDDVLKTEQYTELKTMDNGETTDMRLFHIMEEKEKLSERFLEVLKVSSIDCALNYRRQCFVFPKDTPNKLFTKTDYREDASVGLGK